MNKYSVVSTVVPNGVDHDIFNTCKTYLPKDSCIYLCVATNVPRNNLEMLINTFINIFDINDNIFLILKTNSDKFKNVHNHIIVSNEDMSNLKMASLYKQCNFIISVSHCEGFGLPLCEAIACGKNIISPYYGGICTFIEEKYTISIPFSIVHIPNHIHDAFGNWVYISKEALYKSIMYSLKIFKDDKYIEVDLNERFYWKNIANSIVSTYKRYD